MSDQSNTAEVIEQPVSAGTAPAPRFADELKQMQAEPLLPIEIKLVGWSLALGTVLLGILVLLSHWLFPNP